ncbi:MAG: ArnT family glycosyltransferase [Janthinobacterium lividum]
MAFFLLHFLHLTADFPHGTEWNDWSKYTDEGWYSDAAVRHVLSGHWYLQGDFNSAVALPVWPLLEAVFFRITGVSIGAARALTVMVFGAMLLALWRLIERFERFEPGTEASIAAPLTLLFLCVSPFLYAFERLAILEPLLATLTVVALWTASFLTPWPDRIPHSGAGKTLAPALARSLAPSLALGCLLPAMVLTKPTAIAVFPAIGYLAWHRAGYRFKTALQLAWLPAALGTLLWLGYYLLLVRPRYLEDYQYLFAANAYTGFQLDPLAKVIFYTVADGQWIGSVLYPTCFVAVVILLCLRPRFFRNPLVPGLLLWIGGYFVFLAYHNNPQSRYYLLLAVPVTALTAIALEELRRYAGTLHRPLARYCSQGALAICVLAIVVPDAAEQLGFVLHPEYTYVTAAQGIARVIRADPSRSPLILSVSGSNLTLMTGLPSINTEFGTLDLDQRIAEYRPGWYVAWNELEDEDMTAIAPLYRPVRVAAFPAMDDPDRNVMILYRLDPAVGSDPAPRSKRRIPAPLRTRFGQQPTARQLQH